MVENRVLSDLVAAPLPDVFFTRSDPTDPRLGDLVFRDRAADWAAALVVLIGCPEDEGVQRNQGRPGARLAPGEIRRALYRYPVSISHRGLRLLDIGDIRCGPTLEVTHDHLREVVHLVLAAGKRAVVLGGGNDISYPDVTALAQLTKRTLVLNIDRHLDVRSGDQRNSGTPYRQLLEEGLVRPELFHEVGTNTFANSAEHLEWLADLGVGIHELGQLRRAGVGASIDQLVNNTDADAIFFGFDLDVVRAVEAPGVSDPGPMGLTAREVCEIADVAARDPRTRVIELTEVNPEYDRDGLTAKLAANIIMRALAVEEPLTRQDTLDLRLDRQTSTDCPEYC